MIDALRWLLVIELVSAAALPVSLWLLRGLPDRGYGLSKVTGILLVTYLTWLIGSFVPVASGWLLPAVAVLVVAALAWWFWHDNALALVRELGRVLVVEEALFVAVFAAWCVMRAFVFHPAIAHTEQYMDMALLNASVHSASYPPYDPWMSGLTVNYYYLGYLMNALPIKLSGVAPAVGYNLALSTLFAMTITGAYSLGYALIRRLSWAAVAPLFVGVVGNWHAVLVQVPHHVLPANTNWWFFDSSRVVSAPNDYTINEFPFFSFMLGDLHPHLMALPVTLLATAIGASLVLRAQPLLPALSVPAIVEVVLTAIVVGSLFTINSWDFPTYLVVVSACAFAAAYLADSGTAWWQPAARGVALLVVLSLALFAPFYAHFHSLAHGIGWVATRSDVWQFLQVFGLFLLGALSLVAALAYLLQPSEETDVSVSDEDLRGQEAGQVSVGAYLESPWLVLIVVVGLGLTLGSRLQMGTVALMFGFGVAALIVLERVLNSEQPDRSDATALLLLAAACGVIGITELLYIRDSFDGSTMYRMNTVFKFYYQAWAMLALVAAYGFYRAWHVARAYFKPAMGICLLVVAGLATAGGLVYTVLAPTGSIQNYGDRSLDGMAWLQIQYPSDYAAIVWLQSHAPIGSVVLEATGGDYDARYARVSTFTGLPTVMGWAGHEIQWRPGDGDIGTRTADVRTIYTTASIPRAKALLRKYHVRYVFVGDTERTAYRNAGLAKFGRFMHPVFSRGATVIYGW